MRTKKNKDGSKSYSIELPRFNPERGEVVPTYVFLGHNKVDAKAIEHDLREKERRAALGLTGGSRTFLGTFGALCDKTYEKYFRGRRGEQSEVSRLNRYGGASIGAGRPPGRPPKAGSTGSSRKRKPARPRERAACDEFVSSLGRMPARRMTAVDFNDFFRSLESVITRRGTPMTGKAINRVRETLAKVFEVAANFGLWPHGDNPARASTKLEQRDAPWDIFRPEEIGPMLAEVPPYWLGCCVVALTSALRKGELFGLLKADVDLDRRVFLIWRSHGNDITKGGDGSREPVPIHASALPLVTEWLGSPGPYLFPDETGERRKENVKAEDVLRAALVRAGIVDHYEHICRRKGCGHREQHPDGAQRRCPAPMPGDASRLCDYKLWPSAKARKIPFHATRHTAATGMLRDGVPLASVQKILRHKDPNTTMRMYGHLVSDDLVSHHERYAFPAIGTPPSAATEAEHVPNEVNQETWIEPEADVRMGLADVDWPLDLTLDGASAGVALAPGLGTVSELSGYALGFLADRESSMFAGMEWVEPTGIEPVTYALRTPRIPNVSNGIACQVLVNIGIVEQPGSRNVSRASPSFSPQFLGSAQGAGLPPVSEGELSIRARPDCIGGGSPDCIGGVFAKTAQRPKPPLSPRAALRRALLEPRDELLTVREVACRLKVSTAHIYTLVEAAELGHVRIRNNSIRVSEAELASFIARSQKHAKSIDRLIDKRLAERKPRKAIQRELAEIRRARRQDKGGGK